MLYEVITDVPLPDAGEQPRKPGGKKPKAKPERKEKEDKNKPFNNPFADLLGRMKK